MIKSYSEFGETIDSYIFRVQYSAGILSPKYVISSNGTWLNHPFLKRELLPYFKKYDAKDILVLLNNSGIGLKKNSIYEDNAIGIKILKSFLFNSSNEKSIRPCQSLYSTEVRFCPDCIKGQISQFGVAFFQGVWQELSYCKVHKSPIFSLLKSNSGQTIKDIIAILRGELSTFTNLTTPSLFDQKVDTIPSNSLTFAPCLNGLIEYWIKFYRHHLPSQIVQDTLRGNINPSSIDEYKNSLQFHKSCNFYRHKMQIRNYLKATQPNTFRHLLANNSSQMLIQYENTTHVVYKHKIPKCYNCKLQYPDKYFMKGCHFNTSIFTTKSNADNNIKVNLYLKLLTIKVGGFFQYD